MQGSRRHLQAGQDRASQENSRLRNAIDRDRRAGVDHQSRCGAAIAPDRRRWLRPTRSMPTRSGCSTPIDSGKPDRDMSILAHRQASDPISKASDSRDESTSISAGCCRPIHARAIHHSGQVGPAGNQAANRAAFQSLAGSSRIRSGLIASTIGSARSNNPSLIRPLPISTAISGVTGSVDMRRSRTLETEGGCHPDVELECRRAKTIAAGSPALLLLTGRWLSVFPPAAERFPTTIYRVPGP